jgi:deoxyribodipyrimidine photo-lyase
MRQLAATGWLPNRARMIVASFLVKDLLLDWRLGAEHFMRHLVDGDTASNTGNWRWVAGVGSGSAPWFRIFDPVAQGRRHDPDGTWLRRWLPELGGLPVAHLHEPWLATLPLTHYPARIIDHSTARRRALDAASADVARQRR